MDEGWIVQKPEQNREKHPAETGLLKILSCVLLLCWAGFLVFFFKKYVPLTQPYFLLLSIPAGAVFLLTFFDREKGALLFIFLFPLINNLPNWFDLLHDIPQAPTALVLFLAFFTGWWGNLLFRRGSLLFENNLKAPLGLFSLVILVSAVVTILRFANFPPFLSGEIYELKTNVNGVTAGGAIMSSLFHSLNYLTGFACFFIIWNALKSKTFQKRVFPVLFLSFFIAIIFGFGQRFGNISWGNTPFWIRMGQINATFKDPNAFAAFVSLLIPLGLGLLFVWKGVKRYLLLGTLVLAAMVFPFIGNRSALLGLAVGMLVFFFIWIFLLKGRKTTGREGKTPLFKKPVVLFPLAALILIAGGYFGISRSQLGIRLNNTISAFSRGKIIQLSPERYFLWKEAVHMVRDFPLTGVGLGAFIIELPNYYVFDTRVYEGSLADFRRNDSAENGFLHAAAELGLTGLIFFIWIFIVIGLQFGKTFRSLSGGGKNRYILLGAFSGVVAYLVNLQFHSFIGSNEVKYVFWLLTAVIFSSAMDVSAEHPRIKQVVPKSLLIAGAVLVLSFGSVHLWHSTHSLSLAGRTRLFNLKQTFGLYQLEKNEAGREFRWSGKTAGFSVDSTEPEISFSMLASHPDIRENPVVVRIYIVRDFFRRQELLDQILLRESGWKDYFYNVSRKTGESVFLLFKVSRTWNPMKYFGVPDPRNLGVAVAGLDP